MPGGPGQPVISSLPAMSCLLASIPDITHNFKRRFSCDSRQASLGSGSSNGGWE
jgi:hypothetical protein